MKKIIAVVLVCVMLLSSIGVSAASLDFMRDSAKNYSSDVQMSLELVNADEVSKLLEGEESGIINVALFMKSLLSFDGVTEMKVDISDDYNKIAIYMNQSVDYDVDVNSYMSVAADIKSEYWVDIDLSNFLAPKCTLIMCGPFSEKYMYIDLFESATDEEKMQTVVLMKMILNEQFIEKVNNATVDAYEKYGKIEKSGKTTTLKLDNEAFLKVIDDVVAIVFEQFGAVAGAEMESLEIPAFSSLGINFLGEKGYVLEYSEDGTVKEYCDLEINLNEWNENIYGNDYDYYYAYEEEAEPIILKFELISNGKMFDIGKTEVALPALTEENSVNLGTLYDDMYDDEYYDEDYYEEYYEPEYPYYVDIYTDYLPTVEDEIYVPFRAVLEDAYRGNVNIAFDNGYITVTSEYFTDLEKLSFKVGETKANVDGFDFEVGTILLENGVTYVTADFFEIIFGWSLDWAQYDMIDKEYNISFDTYVYEAYEGANWFDYIEDFEEIDAAE